MMSDFKNSFQADLAVNLYLSNGQRSRHTLSMLLYYLVICH